MKILIIIDSLGSGGAERSTAVLADFLSEQEIFFHIVCLDRKEVGVQQLLIKKGYPITFLQKANFYKQTKQIVSIIIQNDFSVVHSILFRANLRTRFAKLFVNFTHLESLVNTTYSKERFQDERVNQKALAFYKLVDKYTSDRFVDHFHSITKTVKHHYEEKLNIPSKRITVIPRGRKPLLGTYSDKPQKSGSRVQIINVGRHEFQKGQIHLIEAAKILKDEGYSFCLKILGRDGSVTSRLKKEIETKNLNDVVQLEGYKHNVPEYLLNADVFVFPSLYEGLGGALIEAQAAGLPVACNNIPVLHEVVKENYNARFFDSHIPSSIAESLRFFLNDAEERERYGRNSLRNYQENFMESTNHEKMLNLYKSLG